MDNRYVKLFKNFKNDSTKVIYNIYNVNDFLNDGSLTRLLNLDTDFKSKDINLYKINDLELPLIDLTFYGITQKMWSNLIKYKKNGFKSMSNTEVNEVKKLITRVGSNDKYWEEISEYNKIKERQNIIDNFKSFVFPYREEQDYFNFAKVWVTRNLRLASSNANDLKYRLTIGDNQCIACLLYTDENEIEIRVNKAREYLKNELESNGFKFSEDIFDGLTSFYDLRKK
jgi:hypothetical protein